jgi:ferric-dicitrate binding protein FerR (iron transport regulator)
MPAASSPAMVSAAAGPGVVRRGSSGRPEQRISDAERSEVADELSRHYGEGRLDQEEFSQRIDQAMAAKTYRDLTGLLHDLPSAEMPPAARTARRSQRRTGLRSVLLLVLIAILIVTVIHAVSWVFTPVLWLVAIAAILAVAMRSLHRRQ